MFLRRKDLQRFGAFATKYEIGEVVEFYLRLRESGIKEMLLPDVLFYRRNHEDNIGVRKRERQSEYLHILKDRLDRRRGGAG